MEQGQDSCGHCFDGATRMVDGMMGNDLTPFAILLVVDF